MNLTALHKIEICLILSLIFIKNTTSKKKVKILENKNPTVILSKTLVGFIVIDSQFDHGTKQE